MRRIVLPSKAAISWWTTWRLDAVLLFHASDI